MSADHKPTRRPAAVIIERCLDARGLYRVAFEQEASEILADDLDEARGIAEMMAATLGIDIVDRTAPAAGNA